VKGVRGGAFQEITWDRSYRRGLLGKGAFLMATSYANRTTPVLRGAYILEKFLGTPPASPPPSVQAFVETQEGGVALTVRERLESHRNSPSCKGCHGVIDPLGLALENFDVTGAWRIKDNEMPVDVAGDMYDGSKINGPAGLREGLLRHQDMVLRSFTENLMTYAIGRRIEYGDMPAVRQIVASAAKHDNHFSAFILGVVNSAAFRMVKPEAPKALSTDVAQAGR
jgi:hypothetical protein